MTLRHTHTRRIVTMVMVAITAWLAAGCAAVNQIDERIRDEVNERAERGTDEAVENGADAAEDGVRDIISGEDDEALAAPENAAAPGESVNATPAPPASTGSAGGEAWANYDFTPGDRVLFYEDFEEDVVGNFPRRLTLVDGNMAVVEWNEGRVLRTRGNGGFDLVLPERLPERFTVEFLLHAPRRPNLRVVPERPERGLTYYEGDYLRLDGRQAGVSHTAGGEGAEAMTDVGEQIRDEVVPVRLMADGSYVKVYVGRDRVANVPDADFRRGGAMRFVLGAYPEEHHYIDDIRIAAGGSRITYDALMRDGRLVTRGILFATGSADIRPRSASTLSDIARILDGHPDLDLRIEGHTDATGSEEANRALSRRRAEAVASYLVDNHGVARGRLEAAGMGESTPVASNDTEEGRQSNRRVELVVADEEGR